MTQRSPFFSLWGMPIALGLLSASGLTTALISETWGDWWAWLALGVPVAVMAWYAWRPQRASDTKHFKNWSTTPTACVVDPASTALPPEANTVSPSTPA